jgi:hypothetical protein
MSIVAESLNERELQRFVQRVGDRWQLSAAYLGGARVEDAHGAGPQRERGAEYVVVFVSEAFDGVPWLERVYQAANLWDSSEMGADADVHCYTPVELERKRVALPVVGRTVQNGLQILQS